MLESKFQSELIEILEELYPSAIVIKIDPTYRWSFPDVLMLHGPYHFSFETKRRSNSSKRPNQDYYVNKLNDMGFSRFTSPDNLEEVLDAVDKYIRS